MVVNQCMYYSLMLQRHSIKWRLMYYLINCGISQCMCPRITKLIRYMYTNQSCCVKWGTEHSDNFNVSNGVKQGGVISILLLVVPLTNSFHYYKTLVLGCHVGTSYAGLFGYADDIAEVAPSMQSFKKMILLCESYAKSHSITFNPNKSKLLCYNVDKTDVLPPIYLNGEMIPVIDSDKHLGNYISTNIADRHIIDNIYDLYLYL